MSFPSEQVIKILLVKMTSMGDLVHILPTVYDIWQHYPNAHIDWVAEEPFVPIAELSPAIRQVIPVAIRRWRKSWFSSSTRSERQQFRQRLKAESYDKILDLQGLFKSAVVSRMANGPVYGLGWKSAREPYASWWYHHKIDIPWKIHMVQRYRLIAADALGYSINEKPLQFGRLQTNGYQQDILTEPYISIMPSASVAKKLWSPQNWLQVLQMIQEQGYASMVFSGNAQEYERAQNLVQGFEKAAALPPMPLANSLSVLAGGLAMVGLDSGLTHAAAALGLPTIGLYSPTAPEFVPVYGESFVASYGGKGRHAELIEVTKGLEQIFTILQEKPQL